MAKPGTGSGIYSRRDFLKIAGAAAGATALAVWLPALLGDQTLARWGDRLVKGEAGKILLSSDGGQSWAKTMNFGPQFKVQRLTAHGPQLRTQLVFQGNLIHLSSDDAITWTTEGYQAPAGKRS